MFVEPFDPDCKRTMWAHVVSVGTPETRTFFLALEGTEYWTDYVVGGVFKYVMETDVKLLHFDDALTLMLMLWQDAGCDEMWLDKFEKVKDPFR